MFAKIFGQILESSIAEDYWTRHVFMDLLVLADAKGTVDMTTAAIFRRTGAPDADLVGRAIAKLCEPDPESRTDKEDGRRLVLINPIRSWGWQIVNYEQYSHIRDEEARRAYFREYRREQRAKTNKDVQHCSTSVLNSSTGSAKFTHVDVEVDVKELSSNAVALAGDSPSTKPSGGNCDADQNEAITEVWNYYIAKTERHPKTYEFTPNRKRKGLARLRECLKKTGGDLDKAAGLMKVSA